LTEQRVAASGRSQWLRLPARSKYTCHVSFGCVSYLESGNAGEACSFVWELVWMLLLGFFKDHI